MEETTSFLSHSDLLSDPITKDDEPIFFEDNSDYSEDNIFEDNSNYSKDSQSSECDSQSDNDSIEFDITNEVARGLRLLEIKARWNITDAAFKEIITATNGISTSLYILVKTLKNLVPLKPIWVDMCINSCCTFTGNLKTLNKCIYCKAERY